MNEEIESRNAPKWKVRAMYMHVAQSELKAIVRSMKERRALSRRISAKKIDLPMVSTN